MPFSFESLPTNTMYESVLPSLFENFSLSIKLCIVLPSFICYNKHYAYLERLNQTINVLNSFIGDEK